MGKIEILAELSRLSPEDRAKVQAKLDELAGDAWQDRGELSDANQLCGILSQELSRIEPTLTVYAPSPPEGWHLGRAEDVDAENFSFYGD